MANRMKEDEKNERIIRGLLRLPENRRCINCNSLVVTLLRVLPACLADFTLACGKKCCAVSRNVVSCQSVGTGPQYVCTNFWTFVCTTCSGIHREFTHRVKSISMAKFTSQEVNSLQGGGNERAKEVYFKEWDPQRHSVPDCSNVERLRDFIKHVYVDRRFTGERSIDKPPRVNMGDREDSYENRRVDTYRNGSRSPPFEDTYDRRYTERSSPGGRNDEKNSRYNYDERRSPGYGDHRRTPVRFEVVDDRFRDDRSGNGRKSEDKRFSDGESKLGARSPNRQKDLGISSPPVVRPVREILGENVPPLRIGEPPKANGGRLTNGSAQTQRTASSSSLGSIDGNSVELQKENPGSLIDFDADLEPPYAAAAPQTQQETPPMGQSVTHSTSSSIDGSNWASFDFASQEKVSQAPSNMNTLESVLSLFSAPAAVPVCNVSAIPNIGGALATAPVGNTSAIPNRGPATAPVGNMSVLPISGGAPAALVGHVSMLPVNGGSPATAPVSNMSTLSFSGGAPAAAPGGVTSMFPISSGDSFVKATVLGQWPSVQQHQPSLFPVTDNRSTTQQFTPAVGGASNNQPWSSSLAPNAQGPFITPTVQSSQAVSKLTQGNSSEVESQPFRVEEKSSGRKEIAEDLFTAIYPSAPVPVPGWQTGPSRGMGYSMQYPTTAHMPNFSHSSTSTNPFDLNNEPTTVYAPTFPSMVSLQGALPNMSAPSSLLCTSSLGTHSPQWMQPQSPSYASAMPPQTPSYPSAMPPSAYMGQQVPSNMPPYGHQGVGGFGSDGAGFLNTNQQLAGRYSAPTTLNSFSSVGGNPFE
ncbi:hypothetical protein HHK36_014063 [Tetracentron sinense]|uniref:Arf-GAP domain-containing protein n=1 Tax=Tetracentron sinense TaxID=13715 RepID=A0A834Z971_TETSI|nr:hypothetical protein HHK36_014063 [Tetracentron sinense]